ncbi:hypothetical protein [Salinimicrobium soli]|uniref:hypothetical protein n=1 Tax=Salinimicrobium soli TaxID=1254399 RepID=UPI003AAC06E8
MQFVFAFILIFHSVIHLMGVTKAYKPAAIPQLSRSISKQEGHLWFFTSLLLLTSFVALLLSLDWWNLTALLGAFISQLLISLNWEDAKFGTLLNLIIFAVCLYP